MKVIVKVEEQTQGELSEIVVSNDQRDNRNYVDLYLNTRDSEGNRVGTIGLTVDVEELYQALALFNRIREDHRE